MGLISTLARVEAVRAGHAAPLATVRHRHLAECPLVLVPLAMAGETGAPLAAMVGTDRAQPRVLLVPQPRDRAQRFAFLAELAEEVLPHVERHTTQAEADETARVAEGAERPELCVDAAQLLVPNRAGVDFLALLGRSTRFRRSVEDAEAEQAAATSPVPARVPLLGRWLTHYAERAQTPGGSLLLAMTELLARHWASGQSALEDQQLATQLAWICPPDGLDAPGAALRAETERDARGLLRHPPAGPATDPEFDNRLLGPALSRYEAARSSPGHASPQAAEEELRVLLTRQLRPTWDAVWQGWDLLRALPRGARVEGRWKGDRHSFTNHRDRIAAGEAPQPRQDDAAASARKLAHRERAQAELTVQEALDDPLVMAEHRLTGEAFLGTVESVEMAHSEGRSPRPRPIVSLRTEDEPPLTVRDEVYREVQGRQQNAQVLSWSPPQGAEPQAEEAPGEGAQARRAGVVLLQLTSGMGRRKEPDAGTVPEPGERLCWTRFALTVRGGPKLPSPEELPWTHGGEGAQPSDGTLTDAAGPDADRSSA